MTWARHNPNSNTDTALELELGFGDRWKACFILNKAHSGYTGWGFRNLFT